MKAIFLTILALAGLSVVMLATPVWADAHTYKMTTDIPANVMTPDVMETRIGALRFVDGFPTEETAQKVWHQLDFQRAVEVMLMTTPVASLSGFRRSIREWGPDNETMIFWNGHMDFRVLILAPNTILVMADRQGNNGNGHKEETTNQSGRFRRHGG